MIHTISANQTTFHTVTFTPGLNVILAERAETSTQKDTRNGIGKSTLIDIVDFCLGNRAKKGKGLIIDPLSKWEFTIEMTLAGNRVKATRSISEPDRIVIRGETEHWIERPDLDEETGEYVFTAERWRILLGWALFGLPRSIDYLKYKPTFRSLISYFIRTGASAYVSPFFHYRQQKTWDMQTNIAYLLGLNWEYASKWQDLKDQEDGMKALEKAIESGAIEGAVGTIGEMEAQKIQLEQQTREVKKGLDSFKVHPDYESIQAEADELTGELHELTNQNMADRRKLARYRSSITEEKPPQSFALERVYEEVGVVFPEAVKRTLYEAQEFHSNILTNRREFLQTEIDRMNQAIQEREVRIKRVMEQRANALEILRTHGALREITKIQERYVALMGTLDRVQARLRDMKDLKKRRRDVKIAKTELVKIAEQDHEERRTIWSFAVGLFNQYSQALYERPGKLVIDIDETGYRYQVEIERGGSEGIEKMKIFCFDLATLQSHMQKGNLINFLIHDSLMFDSVDARQRAKALEIAAQVTGETGQYICTMNSDMIPRSDFSKEFVFDEYVRLTLTDSSPAGSLLGFRFERKDVQTDEG